MIVNAPEPETTRFLFLNGDEGTVSFKPDNVVCFYPVKGNLTRIFLKECSYKGMLDVKETFEEVCGLIDVPLIQLKGHKKEANCDRLAVAVSSIAACRRRDKESMTELFLRSRTPADVWFFVQETPEQIGALVAEAEGNQPRLV